MKRFTPDAADGFSLLEVLTATAILTVALGALAQLFVTTARANLSAKETTVAAMLATQKMEELTANMWRAGLGSAGRAGSLTTNTFGYCDLLDGHGRSIGGVAPAGAIYIRRWSLEPLPANPDNAVVLQVVVMHWRDRGRYAARLTGLRARKAG